MKRFAFIVFAFAALAACERPFELKEGTLQNRLYLDCLAGAGDTTFVTAQTCIPVNTGKAVKSVRTDIERLSLKVGSKETSLLKYAREGMKYNRWYTLEPIADGQEVAVEVKARGMEAVTGRTTVPAAPVLEKLMMTVHPGDSAWFDVDLRIGGSRSPDDFYGIVCLQEQIYEQLTYDGDGVQQDSIHLESVQPLDLVEVVDENELFASSGDNFFDFTFDGASLMDEFSVFNSFMVSEQKMRMYLPKESFLEKRGHKLSFHVRRDYCDTLRYHQEKIIDWGTGEELFPESDVLSRTRVSYKWKVFRLSPDFYHYAQSRWLLDNNLLSFIGLAPATSAWTNVRGGFGVVAGCRLTETPWKESLHNPSGPLDAK